MNKGIVKNLVIILLLGVTVFSMVRYGSELRERLSLEDTLAKAQGELSVLNQEKQNLLQELGNEKERNESLTAKNANLKAYVKASKTRMDRLLKDKTELETVSAKFTVLKAENRALIESRKRVYLENEQSKLILSSVPELKRAIRALRAKKPDTQIPQDANQGFLIRHGRSTLGKVKIEVVPNVPEAQIAPEQK
jgi:hypothetical protein